MKKVYIVISSWGNHSDHYKLNELCCSSLFLAENKRIELETKYREKIPFPFDHCTYDEFIELWDEKRVTPEEIEIFTEWEDNENDKEEFKCCYIDEIDLY